MNVLIKTIAAASLMAVASLAMADATLKVGSKAPEIKVAKWIKGAPVKSFEKGKVYVVEFWATWCGPCKQSIPHLTELAKKYKGKATFTGVSVWEDPKAKDNSYLPKVEAFVKEWGPKMDYNVAADGFEGTMSNTWMKAAGQNGIPTAFVIDQTGTVAWIGHPMANLDEVVGAVIEGKFDAKAEAARAERERQEEEKAMSKVKPMMLAYNGKKWAEAVTEADKLFADDPKMELPYGMLKFMALANYDVEKANGYARALAAGVYKDNASALNQIAWTMVDDESVMKGADFKLAAELAQQGVAATKETEALHAYILDTLAYAQWKSGDKSAAIATQEKALKVAAAISGFDGETLKEMTERLEKFKKG